MPYLASWQIYPLSQFDVGLVYQGVEHFCPPKEIWDPYQTGLTINIARQLHEPLSLVRFPHGAGTTTPADLSNELLAEAQVSLFRGLYRSAVLNSYQAVESLANVVFKAKQTAKLITGGLAQAIAEAEAEKVRFKHRVDIKFLVHHGLFEACSHSLCNEHKGKYDDLCELNKLRHKVAHAGEKPSPSEAEAAHLLCCEVVQWLCATGGYPVRPLLPEAKDTAPALASLPSDINAIPNAAKAFLLWVLGIAPNQELFESPCQFGLQVGVQASALQEGTGPEVGRSCP
jgi:hypothetical protein